MIIVRISITISIIIIIINLIITIFIIIIIIILLLWIILIRADYKHGFLFRYCVWKYIWIDTEFTMTFSVIAV